MLKKLLIVPWFGKYPDWLNRWVANMEYLKPMGYDFLIVSNLELFKKRCEDKLGIIPAISEGTGKVWDCRPMFGVLFEEELKGYDFWGHTDFDCVYGDVEKFIPDEFLSKIDIYGNDENAICGPWSLYKNTEKVNNLFRQCPNWEGILKQPICIGFEESGFSDRARKLVNLVGICNQSKDWDDFSTLRRDGKKLFEGGEEIMMAHFRRTKTYPL